MGNIELIVEFAADKAHIMETQEGILTILENHHILPTEPPLLETLSIFPGNRQVGMFHHRLRLKLTEQMDEQTLETLRSELSANLEVYDLKLKGDS